MLVVAETGNIKGVIEINRDFVYVLGETMKTAFHKVRKRVLEQNGPYSHFERRLVGTLGGGWLEIDDYSTGKSHNFFLDFWVDEYECYADKNDINDPEKMDFIHKIVLVEEFYGGHYIGPIMVKYILSQIGYLSAKEADSIFSWLNFQSLYNDEVFSTAVNKGNYTIKSYLVISQKTKNWEIKIRSTEKLSNNIVPLLSNPIDVNFDLLDPLAPPKWEINELDKMFQKKFNLKVKDIKRVIQEFCYEINRIFSQMRRVLYGEIIKTVLEHLPRSID